MQRKGFPESYDRGRLVRFLADVKSGAAEVKAPVYSHVRYDIVPGADADGAAAGHRHRRRAERAAGAAARVGAEMQLFASDFFDFTIYVDADERDHRGLVRRPLHEAAGHGLPGSAGVLPPLRVAVRRRGARDRRTASGARSTAATCARTSSPPGPGPSWCWSRAPSTASTRSICAASERRGWSSGRGRLGAGAPAAAPASVARWSQSPDFIGIPPAVRPWHRGCS